MTNTDTNQTPTGSTSVSRRMALVALSLLLIGATMFTVGIALSFGVPFALVAFGALLLVSGMLLGLTS